MAKVIKKRRRVRSEFIFGLLGFSIVASLASSLFLRSYNQKLTIDIQNSETKIKKISNENEVLKIEIQNLVSQERVFEVAQTNKMEINQENVISINR